jgi:hypothetical protein
LEEQWRDFRQVRRLFFFFLIHPPFSLSPFENSYFPVDFDVLVFAEISFSGQTRQVKSEQHAHNTGPEPVAQKTNKPWVMC